MIMTGIYIVISVLIVFHVYGAIYFALLSLANKFDFPEKDKEFCAAFWIIAIPIMIVYYTLISAVSLAEWSVKWYINMLCSLLSGVYTKMFKRKNILPKAYISKEE